MEYFFGGIIFLFGSALGSFIAVVANRYNTGLPFLGGRSFCFSCNTVLRHIDLIPIFSFLSLGGRCRYCKSKIPTQTFVSEILTGIISVIVAVKTGLISFSGVVLASSVLLNYFIFLIVFGIILLISIYDLNHFIIPDSFLVALVLVSTLKVLTLEFFNFSISSFSFFVLNNIAIGFVITLPFLIIFFISNGRWLGFGDVKYIFSVGYFLGLSQGLSAVILAFWFGALFSLLAILLQKIKINLPMLPNNLTIKSEIPFGPFISFGIIISFCFNADLFQLNSLLNLM